MYYSFLDSHSEQMQTGFVFTEKKHNLYHYELIHMKNHEDN